MTSNSQNCGTFRNFQLRHRRTDPVTRHVPSYPNPRVATSEATIPHVGNGLTWPLPIVSVLDVTPFAEPAPRKWRHNMAEYSDPDDAIVCSARLAKGRATHHNRKG